MKFKCMNEVHLFEWPWPLEPFNELFMRYFIAVYLRNFITKTVKVGVKYFMKVVFGPSVHLLAICLCLEYLKKESFHLMYNG